jgi:hypothetical protein
MALHVAAPWQNITQPSSRQRQPMQWRSLHLFAVWQVHDMMTKAHLCRTKQQGLAYLKLVLNLLKKQNETKFVEWIEGEYCSEEEYDWLVPPLAQTCAMGWLPYMLEWCVDWCALHRLGSNRHETSVWP